MQPLRSLLGGEGVKDLLKLLKKINKYTWSVLWLDCNKYIQHREYNKLSKIKAFNKYSMYIN